MNMTSIRDVLAKVFGPREGAGGVRPRRIVLAVAGLAVLSSAAMYGGGAMQEAHASPVVVEDVEDLLARADRLDAGMDAAAKYVESNVAPIERVLLNYRRDPELARRVAVAIVKEANRAGLEPRLLLAVLLVENPMLDPDARSFVGAIGLMQVMPLHRGNWRQCSGPLEAIETNICYGAHIFAQYYRSERDADRALLRYNGCVNGTNTPNCHTYPYHVYARAGRASVLAWLNSRGGSAASP